MTHSVGRVGVEAAVFDTFCDTMMNRVTNCITWAGILDRLSASFRCGGEGRFLNLNT